MDDKIVIGFHYVDEFGNDYHQESKCDIAPDIGYDTLDVLGEQLDSFLSQCGFIRNGYTMLMESLTEDEVEELLYHLDEYRSNKENSDEDNNES